MRVRSLPGLLVVWLVAVVPAGAGHADDVTASVYVRSDTDGTQVVSPRAGVRLEVIDDATHVEAGYSADVWTSASIDIRTAATRRVTEQRDEITVGLERELSDVTLRGDYRFSHESDYVSHGGSLSVDQEFAEGNANVRTFLFAAQDDVGRSGDPGFHRALSTVGARVSFTQVVDPETLVQATYELTRREGFQSSPYRFVGVGGDGICASGAQLCLPEIHPGIRLRHAIVARGRRAIGDAVSTGVEYRFYADDWGVLSHTAIAQLSWLPDDRSTLGARYRLYHQSAADFYEAFYPSLTAEGGRRIRFFSRDRELSPMSTHRLALSYERSFELTDSGPTTRATVSVAGTLLGYRDFVGLDRVLGLDVTLAAAVEL